MPVVLWAIFALCLLPELVLTGADLGLWGTAQWRTIAWSNAGFWAGLLHDWHPNYRLQPVAMFATYGFLHAGPMHFLLNMLTLFSVGTPIVERIGSPRFLVVYAASLIGGAAGFAALSDIAAPMVGASGALFGLIGAWIAWDYRARRRANAPVAPVARSLIWLLALNLLLWWAMNGHLAWQTHLGGFVAGWVAGLRLDRRS